MSDTTSAEAFFEQTPTPDCVAQAVAQLEGFVTIHRDSGRRVVLVTSGGTVWSFVSAILYSIDASKTIPLERNTVRFIDNFSMGTRGATSVEYFLDAGYAVVFLTRKRSIQPFARHFPGSVLDYLQLEGSSLTVPAIHAETITKHLIQMKAASELSLLLSIQFTTVVEYLFLLRECCRSLNAFGGRALIFLAAAVSDFYVPESEMSIHKIQSRSGPLQLTLTPVPKTLHLILQEWCPAAYVVSFKLETNEELLRPKSLAALAQYRHHLVVANLLSSIRYRVLLIEPTKESLIEQDPASTDEIEARIIFQLKQMHHEFQQHSVPNEK